MLKPGPTLACSNCKSVAFIPQTFQRVLHTREELGGRLIDLKVVVGIALTHWIDDGITLIGKKRLDRFRQTQADNILGCLPGGYWQFQISRRGSNAGCNALSGIDDGAIPIKYQ
eukprot:Anaeramoba_flamelloidesa357954_8.p1 GENE.a357954_8~~a357954_8.p1  ORF type:complete len:114 (+),score=13.06 a357954_8:148-489(+)